jgi:hypothetical protein
MNLRTQGFKKGAKMPLSYPSLPIHRNKKFNSPVLAPGLRIIKWANDAGKKRMVAFEGLDLDSIFWWSVFLLLRFFYRNTG